MAPIETFALFQAGFLVLANQSRRSQPGEPVPAKWFRRNQPGEGVPAKPASGEPVFRLLDGFLALASEIDKISTRHLILMTLSTWLPEFRFNDQRASKPASQHPASQPAQPRC